MAKSLEPTQHPIEANSCPAEEIFVITKAKDGEASTTKWGSGQGLPVLSLGDHEDLLSRTGVSLDRMLCWLKALRHSTNTAGFF